MQGFWTVLPMAVVMSAGPQIVTATFFATSADAKRNSLAFLCGVATATTIGVTVFLYLLMPTDLVAMATVGAYIARQGEPWWHTLGFVVLTILIAGLPFIVLLAMGSGARARSRRSGIG
jgi:threonine/homoserine/homoserine lactone efflux protein